jgi:hypothetical protein
MLTINLIIIAIARLQPSDHYHKASGLRSYGGGTPPNNYHSAGAERWR